MRTETVGAVVLVVATVSALVWVGVDRTSYETAPLWSS
jgi:hypothetical protein